MTLEPDRERAQAAKREKRVVAGERDAQLGPPTMQRRECRFVAGDQSDQDVGVAADVLRAGVQRDVRAACKRRKAQRRRPRVVEHHQRALGVRDFGNCRDVLHFEGERSGRLGEHDARVLSELALDRRARQRIVVAHFDTEALELIVAEAPRRTVHRIGDEHVIAGARRAEERQRDGGESRRHRERCVPAFELRHRRLQIGDRRQAVQAIGNAGEFATLGGLQLGDAIEQDGRRAVDRRVDRTQVLLWIAPEVGNAGGAPALAARPLHLGHAGSSSRSARLIAATCASTDCAMSTTIASVGSSSVANWLSSSDAGMKCPVRPARRGPIVFASPFR